jgi:hypothetical protein
MWIPIRIRIRNTAYIDAWRTGLIASSNKVPLLTSSSCGGPAGLTSPGSVPARAVQNFRFSLYTEISQNTAREEMFLESRSRAAKGLTKLCESG